MPEGDDPVLRGGLEIGLEPGEHGAPRRAARRHRIQADEVNPAVIERVVFLRARGDAARLAVGWIVEDLEVRNRQRRIRGARGVVVADRGPKHRLAQVAGIHVEHCGLVFRVGAVVVGVVAEHQPHVGVAACGEARVAIAHARRDGVGGAGIAEHPDARGLRGADRGRGEKGVVCAGGQRGGGGADRVEILRVRGEAGERDLVLGGDGREIDVRRELAGGRPAAHPAVGRYVGAPAHDEARRRPLLQIRPAGDDRRAGLLEPCDPERAIRQCAVDRASSAVARDAAAAFVQSPPPEQPGRRRDLRILVRGDVGGGPRVVPDAHLIEHAAEKPGRDAGRVQSRSQCRVLNAVRTRWPVHNQFRLQISIEEELPLHPVVGRRCVIPHAIHDRRHPRDRVVQPRCDAARAFLEIRAQHIVRRADSEEVIHVLRGSIGFRPALGDQRDCRHAAGASARAHSRRRSLEPRLDREGRRAQSWRRTVCDVVVRAVEGEAGDGRVRKHGKRDTEERGEQPQPGA